MMLRRILSLVASVGIGLPAIADTRVVDGDTLEHNGTVYRLNGIDAPEHDQTCGAWRCGPAATQALVDMVKGHDIQCDAISKDGYGRVIATCYANGADIGGSLVDKGLAWAFVKYSDAYVVEENSARAQGLGIWAGVFTAPWDLRAKRWQQAQATAPAGCPIKGNISNRGRIYHTPWSPWYERTGINTKAGERWFCSEAEALEAGWRAPYWN